MPCGTSSKRPGGRPRKHSTAAAAAEAKKESNRRRYQRTRQPSGPADFIAHEPPLPVDVPTETPPEVGLRTGADVPIPQEGDGRRSDTPSHAQAEHGRPILSPTSKEDGLIATQIEQIRAEERESHVEEDEYEAAILHRLDEMDARTAGILMEMRQGKGGGHVDAGTLPRGPIDDEGDLYGLGASLSPVTKSSGDRSEGTESNDGLGRGYAGLIAERIVEDRISVCNSSTPSTGANHSIEARRLSQAPSQPSSASLSRSNRGASRRSTLFPAQKNTLHGSEPTGSNSIMPPSGLVPVPVEPLTVVS